MGKRMKSNRVYVRFRENILLLTVLVHLSGCTESHFFLFFSLLFCSYLFDASSNCVAQTGLKHANGLKGTGHSALAYQGLQECTVI